MSFRESLNYAHFSGAIGLTTLKSNPGVLHAVVLGTVGATVGAITISDGSNVIAVINAVASTTVAPLTAIYDVRFVGPLTISGGGTTMDFTVSYE